MTLPWLSVVMPTFNGASHLPAALENIARQADDGIEVVAVDDGSTDATCGILDQFKERLNLTIARRPHSGNWVRSSNEGLRLARGRWVCFLHQDDVWLPGRIEAIRKAKSRNATASLIVHPARFIDESGRFVGEWGCPWGRRRRVPPVREVVSALLVQNVLAIAAPVFTREESLAVGGLDEALWYTADWDFWLKLAALGTCVYLPTPLVGFRIHAAAQTATRTGPESEMGEQLQCVLDRHLRCWRGKINADVERAARFSAELNVVLASMLKGDRRGWRPLAKTACQLGPGGWRWFLRDAGIGQRVAARVRAGLPWRRRYAR
jgi:glycosyltransferase involved in cell wall biosynthesis